MSFESSHYDSSSPDSYESVGVSHQNQALGSQPPESTVVGERATRGENVPKAQDANAQKKVNEGSNVDVKVKSILKGQSQPNRRRLSNLNRGIKVRFSNLVNSRF